MGHSRDASRDSDSSVLFFFKFAILLFYFLTLYPLQSVLKALVFFLFSLIVKKRGTDSNVLMNCFGCGVFSVVADELTELELFLSWRLARWLGVLSRKSGACGGSCCFCGWC